MPSRCHGCKKGRITTRPRVWNEEGKVETCFELLPCMHMHGVTAPRLDYCLKKFHKKNNKRREGNSELFEDEELHDGGCG